MVTEKDVNNRFWEYCFEEDDLEAVGKQMALEESIMTVREEGFKEPQGVLSPLENVLHNPQEAPNGKYFEYEIENVEWCCDKMRSKQGTADTFIKEDRVEGEGISRRWYGKCPYCQTPLVFAVSGFCIDKPLK